MSTVLAPAPRPRPTASGAGAAVRPSPRPAPRQAPSAPPARPHLRVVRPDDRPAPRLTVAAGVSLTLLVFVVLVALAGAHSLIAQGQIRLDRIDEAVRAEQARYQALRRDVATAESPARIVAAAEAQGMVMPEDLVYLQPTDPQADGSDADRSAEDDAAGAARPAGGSWSTVKPMLEAPAP